MIKNSHYKNNPVAFFKVSNSLDRQFIRLKNVFTDLELTDSFLYSQI